MRLRLLLTLVPLAIVGCGGGGDSPSADEQAVLRTVEGANVSFAEGDYSRACSYYSPAIGRELAAQMQVESCSAAWAAIDAALRPSMTPSEFDALTSYMPESVEVEGDTATGTYGEPPEEIEGQFDAVAGTTIRLSRVDGRWLISSLPGEASSGGSSQLR